MKCDECKKTNQGYYKTFWHEVSETEKKLVTLCRVCLDTPGSGRTDKQLEEHINTPFWVHGGIKPSPKEKRILEYKKMKGYSWTDLKKEREFGLPRYPRVSIDEIK